MHYNLNVTGSLGYQFGSPYTIPWPNKFPVEIRAFFLGKLGGPFFWHCKLNVTGSLGYLFSSLWTTPWADKISQFFWQ